VSYDCDGPATHYFTCCNACGAILQGEIPNPIPLDWPAEARDKAHALTGYPIEEPPPPCVGPPTRWEAMINDLYRDCYVDMVSATMKQQPLLSMLKGPIKVVTPKWESED
jgi:hypothetical protein